MSAFLFPGQGAQRKGLGKGLFERFPELTRAADAILGYSIEDLCIHNRDNRLGLTQYTQPAMYVVNALAYRAAVQDEGARPDFFAGHSLGEYNALWAAGAFDFETGLRLVQKRGELMSQAPPGAMAAVLGLDEDTVQRVLRDHRLSRVFVANLNAPTQIVISGDPGELATATELFERIEDASCIPLNVSGAFHSPLMDQAQREFAGYLATFHLGDPRTPVIANVTARPYPRGEVRALLARQITSPVRWSESIRYLMGRGETDFDEVGSKDGVLSRMVARIRREATPIVDDDIRAEKAEKARIISLHAAKPVSHAGDRPADAGARAGISASALGSESFKADYNLKYAYYSGSMYKGIASREMVVRMGKAGFLGFLGTGGMRMAEIEDSIRYIQHELRDGESYGLNLLSNPALPHEEEEAVDVFLRHGVRTIEASAYIQLSPALVRFRLSGLEPGPGDTVIRNHRVIAKVSRPEVATAFLSPAPARIVDKLVAEGRVTRTQAELARRVPVADDICAEADSGGHTDGAVAYALLPAMLRLRDDMVAAHGYDTSVRVGAAGGIGTPEAALGAFMLGADFIVTGSINQCTVEAGTSDAVKDMLQGINVQDTDYAPAGDLFELGAKVQVLKKGVFFPARANKLYEIYRHHDSLEDVDEKIRRQIQDKYFKRSFEEVWEETRAYYERRNPAELDRARRSPKHRMALIFKWYFVHTSRLATRGIADSRVDFQVHCGPAMGAFNQWVKGTDLESWRNRHVADIARRLMDATADKMADVFRRYGATWDHAPTESHRRLAADGSASRSGSSPFHGHVFQAEPDAKD